MAASPMVPVGANFMFALLRANAEGEVEGNFMRVLVRSEKGEYKIRPYWVRLVVRLGT